MQKSYNSLGLMSGTSGDGVDASVIFSDGIKKFEVINNRYFEYDSAIYRNIHALKEKIYEPKDLEKLSKEIITLERDITIFHAKIIKELRLINKDVIIGFHGQTIFHYPELKISKQLGDSKLLYQLTKKKIIYNFRKKDIDNGGEGAPLTPIFHALIAKQKNFKLPACFLNIGGISNVTIVQEHEKDPNLFSRDLGPGNCLIDSWVRSHSKNKFDKEGQLASIGKKNDIILETAFELYSNRLNQKKKSYDINDFDISFARGLSIEDGLATLTNFTANIISDSLKNFINHTNSNIEQIVVCGGGRKNKFLMKSLKNNLKKNISIKLIDDYGIDGDFIESQAFAYLAIRCIEKLPITFPSTTGCANPCLGGEFLG